jgi:hypothetical protein
MTGNRRLNLRIGEQIESVVQPSWRSKPAFRVVCGQPFSYVFGTIAPQMLLGE